MLSSLTFITGIISCNNKEPYLLPYDNIAGYVITGEICRTDDAQNYWLLDFTVYPRSPQIGDTLTINGTTYFNVLKVKGLDPSFKQAGMKVSIDYKTVSANKVISVGCNVTSPITYNVKELTIINQSGM